MPVEVVTVGDCPLDDDLNALLAAAREATVNAAKWSGAGVISVYAEVEPKEVEVFVRDRAAASTRTPSRRPQGRGPVGRGRMTRHGGSAAVQSAREKGRR